MASRMAPMEHKDMTESSRPAAFARPTLPFSLHAANDIASLQRAVLAGPRANAPEGNFRLALVDPTPERMQVAARIASRGVAHNGPRGIWFGERNESIAMGKCAFLFPGVDNRPPPRLEEVAHHFGGTWRPMPGVDPRDVLANARQVMKGSILLDRAMRQLGVLPNGLLGLSCGEWAAMTTAGGFIDTTLLFDTNNVGIDFPDMVYLATGIGGTELANAIDAVGIAADAVVSHNNSPAQAIACGSPNAIALLRAALCNSGVFALELPFRSGFHTPQYAPRVDSMLSFLGLEAKVPNEEVWSGVTAAPVPDNAEACRALLRRHFIEPVAFERSILAMYADGYRCFVELGTGSLSQLVTATLTHTPHVALPVAHHARAGHDGLLRALLALWAAHRPVDPSVMEHRALSHLAA